MTVEGRRGETREGKEGRKRVADGGRGGKGLEVNDGGEDRMQRGR